MPRRVKSLAALIIYTQYCASPGYPQCGKTGAGSSCLGTTGHENQDEEQEEEAAMLQVQISRESLDNAESDAKQNQSQLAQQATHKRTHPGVECWTFAECRDEGSAPCEWCGGVEWYCCSATKNYLSSDKCADMEFYSNVDSHSCAKYKATPPPTPPPTPPLTPPATPPPTPPPVQASFPQTIMLVMQGNNDGLQIVETASSTGTGFVVGRTYSVQSVELLRNDLGGSAEYASSIKLAGVEVGTCGITPDGGDYDCTFFDCGKTLTFTAQNVNPTFEITVTGHSGAAHSVPCDCDTSTWECSQENTVSGRTPMRIVARVTVAEATGMSRDEANDGKKCKHHGANRVFDLRSGDASEDACIKKCEEVDNCVAFSGIFGEWCIGCSVALEDKHANTIAYKTCKCEEPTCKCEEADKKAIQAL
jgi:hypothetical protein